MLKNLTHKENTSLVLIDQTSIQQTALENPESRNTSQIIFL